MLELESKEKANLSEEQMEILFDEMIQMCLWYVVIVKYEN